MGGNSFVTIYVEQPGANSERVSTPAGLIQINSHALKLF
jgi:hypothetical protein